MVWTKEVPVKEIEKMRKMEQALSSILVFLKEQEIDCECDTCQMIKKCINTAKQALK